MTSAEFDVTAAEKKANIRNISEIEESPLRVGDVMYMSTRQSSKGVVGRRYEDGVQRTF